MRAPASTVEMTAGDWKFTANGNVNVHYLGLDTRQVFMTFGNDSMGTFLLGRNMGGCLSF